MGIHLLTLLILASTWAALFKHHLLAFFFGFCCSFSRLTCSCLILNSVYFCWFDIDILACIYGTIRDHLFFLSFPLNPFLLFLFEQHNTGLIQLLQSNIYCFILFALKGKLNSVRSKQIILSDLLLFRSCCINIGRCHRGAFANQSQYQCLSKWMTENPRDRQRTCSPFSHWERT